MTKTPSTHDPALYAPLGGSTRQYRHTATGIIISRRQYLTLQRGVTPEAYAAGRQQPQGTTEDKYYRVTQRMRQGQSLTQAAKAEGVAPETVKRLNTDRQTIYKEYDYQGRFKRYQAGGEHRSFYVFLPDGTYQRDVPMDAKYLSIMANYWNEVQNAEYGRPHRLRDFATVTVRDIAGNTYQLLTDINAIRVVKHSMSDSDAADFEQHLYKNQRSGYARAA